MREHTRRQTALTALTGLAALVVLTLAGCGSGSDDTGAAAAEQTSSPSADASAQESPGGSAGGDTGHESHESHDRPDDGTVEIAVKIENGRVTPSGERVDVQVGERIRLVVDSDVADRLHVHSFPERVFRVHPGDDDKQFELTLNQPGVVEVELHELGDVVVSLAARP